MKSLPISFLQLGFSLLTLVSAPLAILSLWVEVTVRGRMLDLAFLLALVGGWMVLVGYRRRWITGCVGFLALFCFCWVVKSTPMGTSRAVPNVQHQWSATGPVFPCWHIGNLKPEVDQFMLGYRLLPVSTPGYGWYQTKEIIAGTAAIYAELEADPDFAELGSVLPFAYAELSGSNTLPGHAIVYAGSQHSIPWSYVQKGAATLKGAGVPITLESVVDGNHFIFFSHRTALMQRLAKWVTSPGTK